MDLMPKAQIESIIKSSNRVEIRNIGIVIDYFMEHIIYKLRKDIQESIQEEILSNCKTAPLQYIEYRETINMISTICGLIDDERKSLEREIDYYMTMNKGEKNNG